MELNWSTFILEIINFLVLVWILKRFFYQPVLGVIDRRRAGIEKTLTDAEATRTEAETLRKRYEERLSHWYDERQQARESLSQELDSERAKRMEQLQTELEKEREKASVAQERRESDAQRKIEETALLQAARFAGRLLESTAGKETENRLIEMVIKELSELPEERIAEIRNSYGQMSEGVTVTSAFSLSNTQQVRLTEALARLTEPNTPIRFEHSSDLLAGVRITIGAWVLGTNCRDELQGFAQLAHDE